MPTRQVRHTWQSLSESFEAFVSESDTALIDSPGNFPWQIRNNCLVIYSLDVANVIRDRFLRSEWAFPYKFPLIAQKETEPPYVTIEGIGTFVAKTINRHLCWFFVSEFAAISPARLNYSLDMTWAHLDAQGRWIRHTMPFERHESVECSVTLIQTLLNPPRLLNRQFPQRTGAHTDALDVKGDRAPELYRELWNRQHKNEERRPACFVHTGTVCGCGGRVAQLLEEDMRQSYLQQVTPPVQAWPEFAAGLELEFVAPFQALYNISQRGFVCEDSSINGSDVDGTGELKVVSTSQQVARDAGVAALQLRRMGAAANKSCGFHIHCDLRAAPDKQEEDVLHRWQAVEAFVFHDLFPLRRESIYCHSMLRRDRIVEDHHAALNYNGAKGTIEFRAAPGTTNYFLAYVWADFVHQIYNPRKGWDVMPIVALAYVRTQTSEVTAASFANHCMDVWKYWKYSQKVDKAEAIKHAIIDVTTGVFSWAGKCPFIKGSRKLIENAVGA